MEDGLWPDLHGFLGTGEQPNSFFMIQKMRVTEIFLSLQGESRAAGLPTVFVRLTGCPLRCNWCDTAYAFSGGEQVAIDGIVERVRGFGVGRVCVTGGEPLAQPECFDLLTRLCDAGFIVSLETSGALDIAPVDRRAVKVVDVKTPSSGEVERNLWANLDHLAPYDEIKFVIGDRADYEWAREVIAGRAAGAGCAVTFSPVHGRLAPATLADWIVADRLPVRFQLQLHKILWGEERGR